ncbi:hypothetical protein T484DRAFT_1773869 [Baffinella frigidus]|nr:hypothetical protein T484DRAFT_1773869 [Cryptophyta sp. CCMP2293]
MFFKRFYLNASVMDCHPKDVMLTAMWLACKVEHYPHRYLNAEKVLLPPGNRDFKFDAKAFADLGNLEVEKVPS